MVERLERDVDAREIELGIVSKLPMRPRDGCGGRFRPG
jgi:hypothetical protein